MLSAPFVQSQHPETSSLSVWLGAKTSGAKAVL